MIQANAYKFRPHDYVLLGDGALVSVHSYVDSDELIIGDVAFVQRADGCYQFPEGSYSKPYLDEGLGREVRVGGLRRSKGALARTALASCFPAKSFVEYSEIVGVVTTDEMARRVAASPFREEFDSVLDWVLQETGAARGAFNFSPTGSLGLGESRRCPHDFDVVLRAPQATISEFVAALQNLSGRHAQVRIFEYNKSWRLRLRTPYGIFCPFFAPTDWDLESGGQDVLSAGSRALTNASIVGTATDVKLASITPSIITISAPPHGEVTIVDFDLRARGDLAKGDLAAVRGLLSIGAKNVLFADSSGGVRNLTPPWDGYYDAVLE